MLYELILKRIELDDFLKSKNTSEFEKIKKDIKVLHLDTNPKTLEEKVKQVAQFKKAVCLCEKLVARFQSKEFLQYSSFSVGDNVIEGERLIDKIEEALFNFELSFSNPLEKSEIKKNFKKFVALCEKYGEEDLLADFAEFDHGEIREIRDKLIYKKPVKNILIMGDFKFKKTSAKKAMPSGAIYHSDLVLDKKFFRKAGINEIIGIFPDYIRLTNTIELAEYVDIKPISGLVELCNGKYYAYNSKKFSPYPDGIAEGYNAVFNDEFAKHVRSPILNPGNLDKIEEKVNLDEIKNFLLRSKKIEKNFSKLVLEQFQAQIKKIPQLKEEIKLTLAYENPRFIQKLPRENIAGHLEIYFSDENIVSKILNKYKIFLQTSFLEKI